MIPIGYMLKNVERRPEGFNAESVVDIYSVSNCISHSFADYVNFWKHNGYWLFDSPQIVRDLAESEKIDISAMTLFYYEVYEEQFNEEEKAWSLFSPEPSFPTAVEDTDQKHLEGYDIATFWASNSPECSPLSCNLLAAEMPVNEHCLLNTFEEAKTALESGQFEHSEPGPFRIFAVYRVNLS